MRGVIVLVLAALLTPVRLPQSAVSRGLVSIYVVAEGPAGSSPPPLTQADFEIRENGSSRPIEFFSAAAAPLSIVLLIDVSRSLAGTMRSGALTSHGEMKESLGAFIAQMRPGDRARIGSIASTVALGPDFSADSKALAKAADLALGVPERNRSGPSPVWDAIDAAVTSLESQAGRRAVLVVTDGMATGNRISLADAANHAANANVSINIVAADAEATIRQSRTTLIHVQPEILLQGLADYTGGLYRSRETLLVPGSGQSLFEPILSTMRQCYALGFRATSDGKPHRIEVRVNRPDLKVVARKVY